MKKVFVLFLCAIICFSAVACSTEITPDNSVSDSETTQASETVTKKEKAQTEKQKSLSLYFSYADSLDPYKAESAGNRGICSLLFDSLIKLDNNLNPELLIASKVEVDGKTVRISLNNYQFSDGSYISADDVVYSVERCKKTKVGDYANQLENVKSWSASGSEVVLTLKRYDKNALCLLDFPIIKKGTANKTNEDGKTIPPIGSGRYVFVDNLGEYSLEGNENYFSGKPKVNIELKNIPDYDALEYLIRSSSIDIYYSGFDAKEMPELKGTTKSVNLTNLVYIGINQKSGALSDKNVRKALSLSVDRADISEKCYYSLSKPALSLYNEGNNIIKNEKNIFNLEDNVAPAVENLKKSGYDNLNKEGFYENKSGDILALKLLYNKENNMQSMVASQLLKQFKACGISIALNGVSASDYKYAVNKGQYDLYVAEVRLTKSFDYSDLLSFPKNVLYNYKQTDEKKLKGYVDFTEIYEKYMKGEITVDEMLESFSEEIPFIPLAFRLGTVSYSDSLKGELVSSISDPYYNIEKIEIK